jgi:hypothetical protein
MKTGLVIVGVWSTILLLLSLMIVGALGPIYDGSFYPFTLPFIVLAGVCILPPISGLVAKKARPLMFWISIPLHGLLILPFRYALKRWPGGDDGPGLAWGFIIGGGSCVACLIALALLTVGIRLVLQKPKETEPSA